MTKYPYVDYVSIKCLHCTFKCPVSTEQLAAVEKLIAGDTSTAVGVVDFGVQENDRSPRKRRGKGRERIVGRRHDWQIVPIDDCDINNMWECGVALMAGLREIIYRRK